ncbi:MAG: tetrahydromethanopterin S-methyltransferase subunit A, partial [Candidatus Nitrosomarinus sp.]
MNKLSDAIGKLCEVLLPIPEEFYIGNTNSSICVCTLSSIKLLKELQNSQIFENV